MAEQPTSSDPLASLREHNARIHRFTLPNGLTVLLSESYSAPLAAIQYWVGAGSIHEGEQLGGGLSHYLEHMLFKGTETRGPAAVATEIADAGGDINAYTSYDRTVYHASLPAENWRIALDVLTDAVFRPAFPEEEWLREREVIFREVAMGEDNPDRVLGNLLWESMFRVNPYRAPIIGWKDILQTMGRDDLIAYHRRHYSPDNMILSIAAAIPLAELEAGVREALDGISRTPREPVFIPAEPPQTAERIIRRTGPYQIGRLAWAFHTPPLDHPDTPVLDMLAAVVSEGRSSPLTRTLREESRLVHDVDAWNYTPKDVGIFAIDAEYEPANEAALIAALRAETAAWQETPFAEERIEVIRRNTLLSTLQPLASIEGQAAAMASSEFFTGTTREQEIYLETIQHVTAADLQRVARQYLRPENGTWVFLVPEEEQTQPPAQAEAAAPVIAMHTLPDGLRIITRQDNRLPLVNVAVVLGGGVLQDPAGKAGTARLASRLLTRGTAQHTAAELAEIVEGRSVSLQSFSGRNSYGLSASGLASDLPFMLEILAETLLTSQFPADELEKERTLQLAAIHRAAEQPMTHAMALIRDALYPGHPYQFTAYGTAETLAAITRDDVAAYHHAMRSPGNCIISIFGDVDESTARQLVETAFAARPQTAMPPPPPPLPPPPAENIRLEKNLPNQQAIFLRAWPVNHPLTRESEATTTILLDALNGLSSDLFAEIRDKRGLAYYAAAGNYSGPLGSLFTIYAGTTAPALGEVEEQVALQTARLEADGLRADEFERAIIQTLAGIARGMQNNAALASQCAIDELLGLGYRNTLDALAHLRTLTPEDIHQAAAAIFQQPHATVLILPAAE